MGKNNIVSAVFILFTYYVAIDAQNGGFEPFGMVVIPGGSFAMGCDSGKKDERPTHMVTIDSFFIDRTEVTQKDYKAIMQSNPSEFEGDSTLPVEQVTWFDAVLYCNERSKRDGLDTVYSFKDTAVKGNTKEKPRLISQNQNYKLYYHSYTIHTTCRNLNGLKINFKKRGYRLPTEAEWEYACRAGSSTMYYWGEKINDDYLWFNGTSFSSTHPVGMKKPNTFGLFDMAGNVWEWCNDWYAADGYDTVNSNKNPRGPSTGESRVLRGGGIDDNFGDVRSSSRYPYRSAPGFNHRSVGFRCVLSLH